MPRYYFHVLDGRDFIDLSGTELPDLFAARREAVRFAGALLSEKPDALWTNSEWTMQVTDETEHTLFRIIFAPGDPVSIERG
ncbi:DUF6894 family protein [Sphingomonas nostoxanthinifaciens]|uniref:DUF6894 family protein n=1 Tax=Sphingomonas nostoxanthinifaciens TaxID=2872652 RepID=UPI001CC1C84E|nr:hypothetical protein [Sphingomonas nostoxanthinifaciens]UAK25619.1 hypothetical protein K8P63_05580 [Sphingomonas nostoxanthinifaciens]